MRKLVKLILILVLMFTVITSTTNTKVDAGYCDEFPDGSPVPFYCLA